MQRYLLTGIEHIFLGYDHIAFLVAVVLWARQLVPVVKIVTAFTVAHSITLSLAALDILVIPGRIVEPAIAASIVFVAVEKFFFARHRQALARGLSVRPWSRLRLRRRASRRSACRRMRSFRRSLPSIIGVEIGQVAVVALCFLRLACSTG